MVVADCDERSLGQVVEHLLVVDLEFDVEVGEQSAHELGARVVNIVFVQGVDLIYLQEVKQTLNELGVLGKLRNHACDIVGVEHVAFDRFLSSCSLVRIFHTSTKLIFLKNINYPLNGNCC